MDDEQRKNILMRIRSGLGRWKHPDGRWELLQAIDNPRSGYPYQVVQSPQRSFAQVRRYGASERDILGVIDGLRDDGFKLAEPTFPELQEFYRNGVPITAATIVGDFFNTVEQTTKPVNGLQAMLEAFK